jgi:ribonuclease VapC
MKTKYILDTSAVITFFTGESGAEVVKNLLIKSEKNEIIIYIPNVVLIEFYYISYKRVGEEFANQMFVYLRNLPVSFINYTDEAYIIQSGRLKAQYPISFADAMISAYALLEDATLVHKDSEFLSLKEELKLQTLPLKV